MRPNAGTKSRIGMVIAGEEMDTGIRELYDGVRKVGKLPMNDASICILHVHCI